jgi:hypothetical protein
MTAVVLRADARRLPLRAGDATAEAGAGRRGTAGPVRRCAVTDLDRLAEQATGIAWRLHDEDPAEVWADLFALDSLRLVQLCCALAAMVDVDQTTAELLAWTGELPSGYQRIISCAECAQCGALFELSSKRRRYCSDACSQDQRRRAWRDGSARRRALRSVPVDEPAGRTA